MIDSNALENALKQIQTWFVNGEFEKVIKGCQEILNAAPSNSIAQDLLKKAQESIKAPVWSDDIPTPAAIEPEAAFIPTQPMPELVMPIEPIAEPPMPESITPIEMPASSDSVPEHHKVHSMIVNLGILIGIVGVGFGMVWAYHAFFGNDTPSASITPQDNVQTEPSDTLEPDGKPGIEDNTEEPTVVENNLDTLDTMDTRNAKRSNDLSLIENALIKYYETSKQYPDADTLKEQLANGILEALPMPPTKDEAYMYAVYSTSLGPNQVYILSGEFEEPDGSKTIWSPGENAKDYADYRDDTKPNVIAIVNTEEETEEEIEPTTPTPVRVPRTPRNAR